MDGNDDPGESALARDGIELHLSADPEGCRAGSPRVYCFVRGVETLG